MGIFYKILGSILIWAVATVAAKLGLEIFFGRPRPGLLPFITLLLITYPLIRLWKKQENEKGSPHKHDQRRKVSTHPIYCPSCKRPTHANNSTCEKCGEPLNEYDPKEKNEVSLDGERIRMKKNKMGQDVQSDRKGGEFKIHNNLEAWPRRKEVKKELKQHLTKHSVSTSPSAEKGEYLHGKESEELSTADLNMILEYSEEAAANLVKLEVLPEEFQREYLDAIKQGRRDYSQLADKLFSKHQKLARPFASDKVNDAFAEVAEIGNEARAEFAKVINLLGEDIEIEPVLEKIRNKYVEPQGVKYKGYFIVTNNLGRFEVVDREWQPLPKTTNYRDIATAEAAVDFALGAGSSTPHTYRGYVFEVWDGKFEIYKSGTRLKGSETFESTEKARRYIDLIEDGS